MEEIIKVATIENEIESNLLSLILKEREIPHVIGTYHDSVYNGIFEPQKGWGYVNAPESYKTKILEVLSDIRKSKYP